MEVLFARLPTSILRSTLLGNTATTQPLVCSCKHSSWMNFQSTLDEEGQFQKIRAEDRSLVVLVRVVVGRCRGHVASGRPCRYLPHTDKHCEFATGF